MTERITKLEAATRQLEAAIRLFLAGDYLSSLTLAGAAEEILGKLSVREGKPVAVEEIMAFHWDDTDPALADGERRKVLLNVMNRPRNEAKHANDPDGTHCDVDRVFALQMIMRSMPMAKRLGAPPQSEVAMVEWIRGHPEAME